MSEIKVNRRRGYTMVYNDLLPEDGSLSARAWGLYVYLVGRPDGWEARASHLSTRFKEGRDAIYAALKELVEAGLVNKEERLEGGLRRTRFTVDVDDATPQTRRPGPETPIQDPGGQEPGGQEPEKPGQVSTEVLATTDQATTEPVSAAAASAKKGTRIPKDWAPSEHLRSWWSTAHYDPEDDTSPLLSVLVPNPGVETANFKAYWESKSGKDATKLDWDQTWQVWIRNTAKRAIERLSGSNVRDLPTRHIGTNPDEQTRMAGLFGG